VQPDVQRLDPSQVDLFFDLLQSEGVEFPPESARATRLLLHGSVPLLRRARCHRRRRRVDHVHVEDNVAFFGTRSRCRSSENPA